MNKIQQKAVRYAQMINGLVQNLEDNQSDLNGDFEKLKKAVETDTVADIPSDDYWAIQEHFQRGTDSYKDQLNKLKKTPAPARVAGTQFNLVSAYQDFVDGCQAMVDSMQDNRTISKSAFAAAEKAQDEASEKISKYIQKLTQLM
ncbi:hypothetical protein FC83_GL001899 [Agrilactobacillus composti DSM 18527 = JCM 14202]|jgi:hypothetical protein|uniref:Uncharacterized protein n=1 Tax=Agrilactobacillus composti DSM 18527 = JCM 14202 TaxID=1423734 RepID=X0PUI4_9LACO|nr:hypothetical protein [Agrilactobacillus composti]KRM34964.1 hypothetical protein FC83_GL001899 [Agrilactobacillus composti DSM 18527 = JCM 14202]MCH4171665.1 hypothetical protein [Lactobacillus sp.]GAF41036.1 hypothetical protein JCM14202_2953 [Agrilactobacillus composti DSM 18527 = JCM 14202]